MIIDTSNINAATENSYVHIRYLTHILGSLY